MGKNDLPVISVHVRAGCFSVRPFFRHDDVIIHAGVSDIARDLAALEQRIFPIEKYGSDVLSAAKFRYFLTKANAITLVVKRDKTPIGYAILLFKKNSEIARLYALAMDENMRGKGVGMVLMNAIESVCNELQCTAITLETRADNAAMQSLSLRGGYTRTDILKSYYFDQSDAFKYRKNIKVNNGT